MKLSDRGESVHLHPKLSGLDETRFKHWQIKTFYVSEGSLPGDDFTFYLFIFLINYFLVVIVDNRCPCGSFHIQFVRFLRAFALLEGRVSPSVQQNMTMTIQLISLFQCSARDQL